MPPGASYNAGQVSVVIPVYNALHWIGECLESALGQTYHKLEITVVDDGSVDDSRSVIQQYLSDRLALVVQENRGQAAATGRAIALTRGEFIAFLDSDDIWKSDKIERQVDHLSSHPEVVFLYTDAEEFSEFGTDHVSFFRRHPPLRNRSKVMEAMVDCHIPLRSTVMVRRSFLDEHAITVDSEAKSVDDVGLFMEILGRSGTPDLLDEVTTFRRMHGGNVSANHFNRFAWRIPMYRRLLARCATCSSRWKSQVRRALSDAECRVGECYWGRGDVVPARQHWREAVRAWRGNRKAWLGLAYTLIPAPLARAIKRAKHAIGRSK